jgi:hypothetical protein
LRTSAASAGLSSASRIDPAATANPFDDPLANGEPHAGSGIGGGAVKTLKISKICSLY